MTILLAEGVSIIQTIERIGSKICANVACGKSFDPTRHNQKYCGKECCKLVTNAKIMEQYYEKKARKAGKKRTCRRCPTTLSRYNEGSLCQSCILEERKANRVELLQLVGVA